MSIAFLHTGAVHIPTFDAILAENGYTGEVEHLVHEEFLSRARKSGVETVRSDMFTALNTLSDATAVVCTCSTVGPLAEDFSREISPVLRIDRPAMEEACRLGATPGIAICLDSTREPTFGLLERCAAKVGTDLTPIEIFCDAWAAFEANDKDSFNEQIAQSVRKAVAANPDMTCVVLAQASMYQAALRLSDLKIPVLTTPHLAVRAALDRIAAGG